MPTKWNSKICQNKCNLKSVRILICMKVRLGGWTLHYYANRTSNRLRGSPLSILPPPPPLDVTPDPFCDWILLLGTRQATDSDHMQKRKRIFRKNKTTGLSCICTI